jgi:predicted metal-dependent peptidase
MKTQADSQQLLDKVQEGFRRVGLTFPHLAGLIQMVRPQLDPRVETMGVFASGRLVVNPEFVAALSAPDLMFVLTHELYHLALRTHERGEGADPHAFNCAHDYIINDMLREELQVGQIPAGGLDRPGARLLSAEKILGEMQRDSSCPQRVWQRQPGQAGAGGGWDDPDWGDSGRVTDSGDAHNGDAQAGDGQGNDGPAGDVLNSTLEREWFPDLRTGRQQEQARAVREEATRAMGLKGLMESMAGRGRGDEAGAQQDTVAALRGLYRPPWELALQRWMESVAPSDRSYARPSRRGADRRDVVLPGRKREGWILHIVLDTSGSMIEEVPRALGAIADFCEAMGVEQVHLVQCDTEVGRDEILAPGEMARWQVTGYGGSDLGPAMLRLADDADVACAIVVTDGDIDYPQTPVPYSVLWVLPAWKNPEEFTPSYGKVIAMTHT